MGNKLFFTFLALFGMFFFSWYTMVFSNFYKNAEIKYIATSSKNLFLDIQNHSQITVYFNSTLDISKYNFSSSCNVETTFLKKQESLYVFGIKIWNNDCKNGNFYLQDESGKVLSNTHFSLWLISDFDLYNTFVDYDDLSLKKALENIKKLQEKYKLFSKVDVKDKNIDLVKKSLYLQELKHKSDIIQTILTMRTQKYIIPVEGYQLPEKNLNKLPNGARPYRAAYTDGIHEWWDIDAPLGAQVRSLDAGIIVKIVRNFKFSDLSTLKTTGNISLQDKINNLDILRWNQVWVKTMKWDVVFYSHLNKVYDDIRVGNIVAKWHPLGTIGKTWVPDKDYDDYHLHFEVRKNPYIDSEAGKYSLYDYMNWSWYFKWEKREYIRDHQYEIFQK